MNKFRHGCLVMKLPDSDAAKIPTVLFGTINGTIGVLASLPQEQFKFLERLQVPALASIITPCWVARCCACRTEACCHSGCQPHRCTPGMLLLFETSHSIRHHDWVSKSWTIRPGLSEASHQGRGRLQPRRVASVSQRAHRGRVPQLCGRGPHRAVPGPQAGKHGAHCQGGSPRRSMPHTCRTTNFSDIISLGLP